MPRRGRNSRRLSKIHYFLAAYPYPTVGCWIWPHGLTGAGYAMGWWAGKKNALVHRVSYTYHKGPIPPGLHMDHLCRNRACANPDHLEPVTCRTNCLRGVSIAAANAKKTHCPNGHPFADSNLLTYTHPRTGRTTRRCAACHRTRQGSYMIQKRQRELIG